MQERLMVLLEEHFGTLEVFLQAPWGALQVFLNNHGIKQHMETGLDMKCMLQIALIQAEP